MLALSQDLRQNRPVEAREHVRRFHELFFTYGPEKSAIEGNVNRLIAGGILQTTQVDSVVCDMNAYPYRARAYVEKTVKLTPKKRRKLTP